MSSSTWRTRLGSIVERVSSWAYGPSSDGSSDAAPTRPAAGWRRYGFIALVYTVAHSISLLNRGLFWDDWVFWQQDRGVVAQAAKAMGSIWPWQINELLYYNQAGITLDRVLTFAALLATALLIFDILRRLPGVDANSAMWVAVVFGVFPAYQARVALVLVGYALCLLFFTSAVWLLVRYSPRPNLWARAGAIVLFVASFHLRSLLVLFYAVVPLAILLLDPPERMRPGAIAKRFAGYADQLLMPIVFWVVAQIWFRPSWVYADYNEIKTPVGFLSHLTLGATNALETFVDALPGQVANVSVEITTLLVVAAVIVPLTLLALRRWPLAPRPADGRLLHAGLFLVFAAALPYAAVGKVPASTGWETRHQLLLPIGAALVVAGLVAAHRRPSNLSRLVAGLVLAAVLSVGVASHVDNYIRFQRDWLKQEALIEAIKAEPRLERARLIVVNDRSTVLDRNKRLQYEWTGLVAEAFGDQKRLAYEHLPAGDYWDYASVGRWFAHKAYYKAADYEGGGPYIVMTIRAGKLDLRSRSNVLKLTLLDWTDRAELRRRIRDGVSLELKDLYRPNLMRRP